MKDVLVGNKQTVRWPKNVHATFKELVDDCFGFRGFAALFDNAPENFDKTISRIYKKGTSHPDTFKLISEKMQELENKEGGE